MSQDPIVQFSLWLEEAKQEKTIAEPTAMALATADRNGRPAARMVLLKAADARGFVFYTNLESAKSNDLNQNPQAALCFHWMPLKKQVRVQGRVERVSDEEADAYFATRPRESQIGAWASRQSRPLASKAVLVKDVGVYAAKFMTGDVPRPPHWSGWRIVPDTIEFWSEGAFRLHDREVYTRDDNGWKLSRLYP